MSANNMLLKLCGSLELAAAFRHLTAVHGLRQHIYQIVGYPVELVQNLLLRLVGHFLR